MIVAAAVCPGAPFLVPGVADRLAAESAALVAACTRAVRALAGTDRIVLIAAGRGSVVRVFPPGVDVPASPLCRSDVPLRSGPGPAFAVGSIVGRALLSQVFSNRVGASGSACVPAGITTVETGDDPEVARIAIGHHVGAGPVGLLVIADGAAAHGDQAPGKRDDRSAAFDDALARAFSSGDPDGLRAACADRDLARQLLAVTDPLLVLADLTRAEPPPAAELLYRGTPYGVGYFVATWQWSGW